MSSLDHFSESIGIQTDASENSSTQTDESSIGSNHNKGHAHRHHHTIGQFSSSTEPPPNARDTVIYKRPPQICTDFNGTPGFTFKISKPLCNSSEASESGSTDVSETYYLACNSPEPNSPDHFYSAQGSPPLDVADSPRNLNCSKITTIFQNRTSKPFLVVLPPPQPFIAEQDVTEEFVIKFNKEIGNNKNYEEAERLLTKMKGLGGLTKVKGIRVNIPSARLGLCILSQLSDHKLKMAALDNLYEILKNDAIDADSANQLVTLMKKFMKNMHKDLFQTEIIEDQIKIAKVFNVLASTLKRQYAKEHINGITSDLKTELILTAKALKDINRQENNQLTFYVNCALQGIRYLKDDSKALLTILNRIYKFGTGIAAITMKDSADGFTRIDDACTNLDPHVKKKWYNLTLLLEDLAKDALTDKSKLTALQLMIQKNYKTTNWKFSYAAMLLLTDITLKGKTEEIRHLAFNGVEQLGFPGLVCLSGITDLKTYLSWKPVLRLEMPKRRDPNVRIRYSCVENLLKIINETKDVSIGSQAKRQLSRRLKNEQNQDVLQLLIENLPKDETEKEKKVK